MRIAIYATARDESKNVEAWYRSTAGADVVVVNDSGSTDDTVERFRALGVDVRQEPVSDAPTASELFNLALSLLPEDVDLCIRLDLDERLAPGWRDAVEEAWEKRATTKPLLVPVWFDHGNDGNPYLHTRCHSRLGFQWIYPIHELLADEHGHPVFANGDTPCVERIVADATIEHHQDFTKDRSSVLDGLIKAHDADPTNPRWMHYLGREYTYRAEWSRAIPLLRLHVESFDFAEQCSESWRLLGDCYRALLPVEDVPLAPYRSAAATAPARREGWVNLAELCMEQGRWPECLAAATAALAITERDWYLNWPWAWGGLPYNLAALACWYTDRPEEALEYGRRALELDPANELYKANLVWYEGAFATS